MARSIIQRLIQTVRLSFVLLFLSMSAAQAAVLEHAGPITQNTTWTSADEHIVTGDVTVPAGLTLTVEAGAVIKFKPLSDSTSSGADNGRSELRVDGGSLIVNGTATSPVTFTSDSFLLSTSWRDPDFIAWYDH